MSYAITSICAISWLLLLSGCATPVGQFKDSDLTWSHAEVALNYQAVYRNVREGFRKCGSHFFADGNLYTDVKEGHFDIYLTDVLGGKSAWVYGIVRVKYKDEQSSDFSVGVNKVYDNPVFGKKGGGREMIAGWASGRYECEERK